MLIILGLLVLAAVAAVWFARQGESQQAFVFQLRPNSGSRLDSFKWLAVLLLIPAGPLLFFGLAWFVPGLFALGLAFVAAAVLIWRAFAQEWPVGRRH